MWILSPLRSYLIIVTACVCVCVMCWCGVVNETQSCISMCLYSVYVCVRENVSLSRVCLGKDSGQQGTGWVQGRGRARRERSGYSFSTRGVLLPFTYSVCRWGSQTPYSSPLHFLSFIPFWIHTHKHTYTHTWTNTPLFSSALSLSLSPPTSLILSAGEWMVFRVNYVWLRDDGEWMDLRGSVRVERGAGIHIGV